MFKLGDAAVCAGSSWVAAPGTLRLESTPGCCFRHCPDLCATNPGTDPELAEVVCMLVPAVSATPSAEFPAFAL